MALPAARPTPPQQQAMPLGLVSGGQCVTIQDIRGGYKLQHRLRDLGLNLGASVRVLKNDAPGPLIIAVKEDSRLALGRGMAFHILVTPHASEQPLRGKRPHDHHHRPRRQPKRR
jgi:ferrous iron transport protein A